jgi:hypothetical protein
MTGLGSVTEEVGRPAKKVLRLISGHKPGSTNVHYHGEMGGHRTVTIKRTGSSNRFMYPKKSTEVIELSPPGTHAAKRTKETTQDRELKPGAKFALGTASVLAPPALAVGGAGAVNAHNRAKARAKKLKVRKSMDSISAFGVDHGYNVSKLKEKTKKGAKTGTLVGGGIGAGLSAVQIPKVLEAAKHTPHKGALGLGFGVGAAANTALHAGAGAGIGAGIGSFKGRHDSR